MSRIQVRSHFRHKGRRKTFVKGHTRKRKIPKRKHARVRKTGPPVFPPTHRTKEEREEIEKLLKEAEPKWRKIREHKRLTEEDWEKIIKRQFPRIKKTKKEKEEFEKILEEAKPKWRR